MIMIAVFIPQVKDLMCVFYVLFLSAEGITNKIPNLFSRLK